MQQKVYMSEQSFTEAQLSVKIQAEYICTPDSDLEVLLLRPSLRSSDVVVQACVLFVVNMSSYKTVIRPILYHKDGCGLDLAACQNNIGSPYKCLVIT